MGKENNREMSVMLSEQSGEKPQPPSNDTTTTTHTLHIDFCGPFPTRKYLLVVIDAYSRFPKGIVSGLSTPNSLTPSLSTIFALQLLIASHKQFRGVLGGRAPQF